MVRAVCWGSSPRESLYGGVPQRSQRQEIGEEKSSRSQIQALSAWLCRPDQRARSGT